MLSDGDYRGVFEASPDAMLIVDSNGVIRDANSHALEVFGWSREEMRGFQVERLIPAACRGRHQEHRRRYSDVPRVRCMGQGLEVLALHRDGTSIPVEIRLSPRKLASGQKQVICTIRETMGRHGIRHLSRTMVQAVENERKRFSSELRGGFLQSLVALKIRTKLLAAGEDTDDRERMRLQIADEIDDTIEGVKRKTRELVPPQLDHQDLSSALGTVFRDVREVYGFTVHANLDRVDAEVDAGAALALYRIVHEAVTNSARHAQVDEATVTLRSAGDVIIAEIRDAGCGFELADSVAARGDGHAGLVGMRDRAALFGGDVAILTSPGNGTAVRATVPICPDHSEDSRTVVRVLLVDEHAVVRAGLKALLETDERMEVVGEASTAEEAVEQARTLEPGTSSSWTCRCLGWTESGPLGA